MLSLSKHRKQNPSFNKLRVADAFLSFESEQKVQHSFSFSKGIFIESFFKITKELSG